MPGRTREDIIANRDRFRTVMDQSDAILGPLIEPQIPTCPTDANPARAMRALVDEGKATLPQNLAGAKDALHGMTYGIDDIRHRDPQAAAGAIADDKRRTGRNLWSNARPPVRQSGGILQCKCIRDETEAMLVGTVASYTIPGLPSVAPQGQAELPMTAWCEGRSQ